MRGAGWERVYTNHSSLPYSGQGHRAKENLVLSYSRHTVALLDEVRPRDRGTTGGKVRYQCDTAVDVRGYR